MENSSIDSITVINSVVVLLDYQTNKLESIESGGIKEIKNAVIASAKAASMLHLPVILTAYNPVKNGVVIKELTDLFARQEVLNRSVSEEDAFEDEIVLKAVKKSRRGKLILAGLLTSICFAGTALHGIREGFDVYGLIDACGDTSPEAHNSGIQRMLAAGVTPLTWISLTSELMNGSANPSEGESPEDTYDKYSPMLYYLSKPQPLRSYK